MKNIFYQKENLELEGKDNISRSYTSSVDQENFLEERHRNRNNLDNSFNDFLYGLKADINRAIRNQFEWGEITLKNRFGSIEDVLDEVGMSVRGDFSRVEEEQDYIVKGKFERIGDIIEDFKQDEIARFYNCLERINPIEAQREEKETENEKIEEKEMTRDDVSEGLKKTENEKLVVDKAIEDVKDTIERVKASIEPDCSIDDYIKRTDRLQRLSRLQELLEACKKSDKVHQLDDGFRIGTILDEEMERRYHSESEKWNLKWKLKETDEKISELQAQNEDKDEKISELQVQNEGKDEKISELQMQNEGKDEKISMLQKENKTLQRNEENNVSMMQDKDATIERQKQQIEQLKELLRQRDIKLQEKDEQLQQQSEVMKNSTQERQRMEEQYQETRMQLQDEQNKSIFKRISEGILKRLPEGIRSFLTRNKTPQLHESREIKELNDDEFNKSLQCDITPNAQVSSKAREDRTNTRAQGNSDGFDYDDK